ncbi:hypothetical protein IDM32_15875 [Acinetobacter seifertii]|nr:hypothetical protein [Acinetobacter seifertii]
MPLAKLTVSPNFTLSAVPPFTLKFRPLSAVAWAAAALVTAVFAVVCAAAAFVTAVLAVFEQWLHSGSWYLTGYHSLHL